MKLENLKGERLKQMIVDWDTILFEDFIKKYKIPDKEALAGQLNDLIEGLREK